MNDTAKKEPEIKELEDRQVAYVSFTGDYMRNTQVFKNLFDTLCGWAGPKGLITQNTVFLSSYPDNPEVTAPDDLTLNVCMTVGDDAEGDGEVKKKVLPGGKYASMTFELVNPEEYGTAWKKVVDWARSNGYELDMSRPSYEVYLNNPEEHPEKHHIVEICLSVKQN